jgi:hypothetical protein
MTMIEKQGRKVVVVDDMTVEIPRPMLEAMHRVREALRDRSTVIAVDHLGVVKQNGKRAKLRDARLGDALTTVRNWAGNVRRRVRRNLGDKAPAGLAVTAVVPADPKKRMDVLIKGTAPKAAKATKATKPAKK